MDTILNIMANVVSQAWHSEAIICQLNVLRDAAAPLMLVTIHGIFVNGTQDI